MGDLYSWVLAFHIIAIITWMAGLLYLPRLFVYHCQVNTGSEASETFKLMERRLLKYIMNPSIVAAWILGLGLLYLAPGWWSNGWLHGKLLLVVLMSGMHGMMAKWQRDFENDRNQKSDRFYRVANEVPTVLMVLIVILVAVKPF